MKMPEPFNRHERIALQVSGGKDSTAALFALRPWWQRLTVYWLNTGHAPPEVRQHVDRLAALVPAFREVAGRRDATWQARGWPADLVPVHFTPFGQKVRGTHLPLIQGRYECCWHSLMEPLQERMAQDGITLIVRGQKNADCMKGPLRSGDIEDGFEVYYPLQQWTDQQVYAYLRKLGVQLPQSYDVLNVSPDCIDCTAWWGEQRSAWLRAQHPDEFREYQVHLKYIRHAIGEHLRELDSEVM
jgi:3'-phosphoadenosine 5'-phosphosulfate sulfotransferase (PAPS reductase)/FAD synthetase